MGRKRKESDTPPEEVEFHSQLTGSSAEAIENEMIALAYNEVEYRIRNHLASSQELVHFLRMGSEKERREREKLDVDIELQKVKAEAIRSAELMEKKYEDAINAMKLYSGSGEL